MTGILDIRSIPSLIVYDYMGRLVTRQGYQ